MAISFRRKEKALMTVQQRYSYARDYQKPLFDRLIRYYRIYRSVRDLSMQNYNGRANLFVPYVYANIENAYPKMISSKPRLNVFPREESDKLRAEVVEKLLDYQWYKYRMKGTLKDWVKQGLIYGTSPLKVTWEFDAEKKKDEMKFSLVPVWNFYTDPDATCFNDARYAIHEVWKNVEELRKNPNYSIPRSLTNQAKKYNEYETRIDSIKNQSKRVDATNEKVKLWEYWGLFDIDGTGIEVPCLIVVANEQYVIRIEKNPYKHQMKPFIIFRDVIVPSEFWGIGEIEPVESLQYELNDTRNQRMDNVTQILRSMPIASRQSNIRPHDIKNWQNGNVLMVDGAPDGSVSFARPPDVTSSSYNEETLIKGDLQFVSSLTDVSPIVGQKRAQALTQSTATGAALQREESNARFRAKIDNLEDSLVDLATQMIALNQQFIDSEQIIRVLGKNGRPELFTVKPKDIKGEFDLIAEAGATQAVNKQLKRLESERLANTLTPFVQAGIVKADWVVRNILKNHDIENLDEVFVEGAVAGPGQDQQASLGLPQGVGDAGQTNLPKTEDTPSQVIGTDQLASQLTVQ